MSKVKAYLLLFFISILIVSVFTAMDYYVHSWSDEYAVPSYYFTNKLMFGTLLMFLALTFTQKMKLHWRALTTSLVVSALLQTRYFFEGYPTEFVLEFLLYHFLMLVPTSFLLLWLSRNLLKSSR
jgi:peptidoglycan/LPS O-acetylase OafA/YrhL